MLGLLERRLRPSYGCQHSSTMIWRGLLVGLGCLCCWLAFCLQLDNAKTINHQPPNNITPLHQPHLSPVLCSATSAAAGARQKRVQSLTHCTLLLLRVTSRPASNGPLQRTAASPRAIGVLLPPSATFIAGRLLISSASHAMTFHPHQHRSASNHSACSTSSLAVVCYRSLTCCSCATAASTEYFR